MECSESNSSNSRRWLGGVTLSFVLLLSLTAVLLLLTSCSSGNKVTCNDPYILVGDSCCLDKDSNGVCDSDEEKNVSCEEQKVDCSECPPQIVTRNRTVEVVKYICDNGVEVENPDHCGAGEQGGESVEYSPVKDRENSSVFEVIEMRPACRGSGNAGEIHYKMGAVTNDFTVEVKDGPNQSFTTVYNTSSSHEDYIYFGLCEGDVCKQAGVGFGLENGRKYLVRLRFDFTNSFGRVFYSNDYVVDATDDGEYSKKLC